MSKNMVEAHNMAFEHGILLSNTACTHAHAWAHAPTHQHPHPPTHTEKYVILIAFPQQLWFHEHATMLCYTYIACLCVNKPLLCAVFYSVLYLFVMSNNRVVNEKLIEKVVIMGPISVTVPTFLPWGTFVNHRKPQDCNFAGWDLKLWHSEYKAGMLPTQSWGCHFFIY